MGSARAPGAVGSDGEGGLARLPFGSGISVAELSTVLLDETAPRSEQCHGRIYTNSDTAKDSEKSSKHMRVVQLF